jgi:hypothetical protein
MSGDDANPVDEARQALIAERFHEYRRTRLDWLAAEQLALEFSVKPEEVIAWGKRFPEAKPEAKQ